MANGYIVNEFHSTINYNVIDGSKSGKLTESARIQKRLNGFDATQSNITKTLNYYFSTGTTHRELVSIARIICLKTNLKLDRLAVRDQRVLIKWFEENWAIVYMILPSMQLLDENKVSITLARELQQRIKK